MTTKCATEDCKEPAIGQLKGKHYCEECIDGWQEYWADMDGPDPHGDRDPTPEQQAGWAMQDKIDRHRSEY